MKMKKWLCIMLSAMLVSASLTVPAAAVTPDTSEAVQYEAEADSVSVNETEASEQEEMPRPSEETLEAVSTAEEDEDAASCESEAEEVLAPETAAVENAVKTPGAMKVYAVWVGGASGDVKGDCVLLEADGEYLLMDMGSPESYDNVKKFLNDLGVKRLSLYYSHTHEDHTGGLVDGGGYEKLLKDFAVEKVYVPDPTLSGVVDHSWHYEKINTLYTRAYPNADLSQTIVKLTVGSSFQVGSIQAKVLGPVSIDKLTKPKNAADKGAQDVDNYENNLSLVTKFTCAGVSYLACGDCLDEEEALLVKKYGKDLKADIFKMDHHGWSSGNTKEFLDCVRPQISFGCSTGATDLNTDKDGLKYRETRSARRITQKTGVAFLTGDEGDSLKIDTTGGKLLMYRMKEPDKALTGWVKLAGGDGVYLKQDTYYIQPNGKPLTGFQEIDGKLYDFGTGGCMERSAYVSEKGKVKYSGWVKYEKGSENRTDKDSNYDMRYIDEKTGEIMRGLLTIGGETYALDAENGARLSGVHKIGKYYYFVSNPGTIWKNRFCYLNGKKYYADKNGHLATGITKIGGKYYAFNEQGEAIKGNSKAPIVEIGEKYYHVGTGGQIHTNVTYGVNGVAYRFDKTGKLINVPKVTKTEIAKLKASGTSLEVSWKKQSKVDGYAVYISTKSKSEFKEAKLINKKKTTKAKIKGLKKGTTYYVKVRAYKKLGANKIYSKYSKTKKIKL